MQVFIKNFNLKIVTFIFSIICSITVYSDENKPKVVIGIENLNYAPLVTFSDNTSLGYIPDLINEVAKLNNIEVEIIAFPVARLKRELVEGNIDLQFPDNINWRVDNLGNKQYSLPVVSYTDCYFAKTASKKVRSVGTPLGFTVVAKPEYPLDIANATSIQSLFSMLEKDRIDAIYVNSLVAENYANLSNLDIVQHPDLPCDKSYFYFSSLKEHYFVELINQFIESDSNIRLLNKHQLKSN